MKIIDILRPVTLGFVILLSVSLLPVAHAEHSHDRGDDPAPAAHEVRRDHGTSHGRHDHRHRPESRHYRHHRYHHVYWEDIWRDHPHPVIWERPVNRPQLIIRLPWLIYID